MRLIASCGFRYPLSRVEHPELAAVPTAAVPGHFDPGSANVANTSASCGVAQETIVAVCPFGSMHCPVLSEKTADFL